VLQAFSSTLTGIEENTSKRLLEALL